MTATTKRPKMTWDEKQTYLAPLKAAVEAARQAKRDVETFRADLERGLRMAESWEVKANDLTGYRKLLLQAEYTMAERNRLVAQFTEAGVRLNRFDRGVDL